MCFQMGIVDHNILIAAFPFAMLSQAVSRCRSKKQATDVDGSFVLSCDHGVPAVAVFMNSGENWCYATMAMTVVVENGVVPRSLEYDIVCQWGGHFLKYIPKTEWPAAIKRLLSGMAFPVPPFHKHMHDAECRKQNTLENERFAVDLQGLGEPLEQLWASTGACKPWRYYTLEGYTIVAESTLLHIAGVRASRIGVILHQRIRWLLKLRVAVQRAIVDAEKCIPLASRVCFQSLQISTSSPCMSSSGDVLAVHLVCVCVCVFTCNVPHPSPQVQQQRPTHQRLQDAVRMPLPCAHMTVELLLVSVRCELAAFEAAAAGGPVPAELLNPGGRKLKAAYLKKLAAQDTDLRARVPRASRALSTISSVGFKKLVVQLAEQQVCEANQKLLMCATSAKCIRIRALVLTWRAGSRRSSCRFDGRRSCADHSVRPSQAYPSCRRASTAAEACAFASSGCPQQPHHRLQMASARCKAACGTGDAGR